MFLKSNNKLLNHKLVNFEADSYDFCGKEWVILEKK